MAPHSLFQFAGWGGSRRVWVTGCSYPLMGKTSSVIKVMAGSSSFLSVSFGAAYQCLAPMCLKILYLDSNILADTEITSEAFAWTFIWPAVHTLYVPDSLCPYTLLKPSLLCRSFTLQKKREKKLLFIAHLSKYVQVWPEGERKLHTLQLQKLNLKLFTQKSFSALLSLLLF